MKGIQYNRNINSAEYKLEEKVGIRERSEQTRPPQGCHVYKVIYTVYPIIFTLKNMATTAAISYSKFESFFFFTIQTPQSTNKKPTAAQRNRHRPGQESNPRPSYSEAELLTPLTPCTTLFLNDKLFIFTVSAKFSATKRLFCQMNRKNCLFQTAHFL